MTATRMMKSAQLRVWFAVLCASAVLVALPVASAPAHGGALAVAKRPELKQSPLRLVGVGGFRGDQGHALIRVTVCLLKRSGGQFVAVRCNTKEGSGRGLVARVNVPGCVDGAWRTAIGAQAYNRSGTLTHSAFDRSGIYRC